jgi:hypothetical protein
MGNHRQRDFVPRRSSYYGQRVVALLTFAYWASAPWKSAEAPALPETPIWKDEKSRRDSDHLLEKAKGGIGLQRTLETATETDVTSTSRRPAYPAAANDSVGSAGRR